MLNDLIEINKTLINQCNDDKQKKKYILIGKLLEDKNCFFKMSMEESFGLLRELGISEEDLIRVYSELIDSENYK